MKHIYYSPSEYQTDIEYLSETINKQEYSCKYICPILRGGAVLAVTLQQLLFNGGHKPRIITPEMLGEYANSNNTLIVDDILDTGKTLKKYDELCYMTAVVHQRVGAPFEADFFATFVLPEIWVDYWWENKEEEKRK